MRGGGYKKAPDPAIWNQTRGTPYAGKAFSRAGAPRMLNIAFRLQRFQLGCKKGACGGGPHGAADGAEGVRGAASYLIQACNRAEALLFQEESICSLR